MKINRMCERSMYQKYCSNTAKVNRDGKWYCTIHDPARLEELRKKKSEQLARDIAKRKLTAAAPELIEQRLQKRRQNDRRQNCQ